MDTPSSKELNIDTSHINAVSLDEVSSLNQLTITTDLIGKMSDDEEEEKMLADT